MFGNKFRLGRLAFFIAILAVALLQTTAGAVTQSIHILTVDGTIVPVIADYIDRGVSQAEDENAAAVIIELNTPGGLLGSTEQIVQKIMNADVPVIVYVSPKAAWAASAGTFITFSGHIAAMTPGTTIGAAHPVSGGGQEIPEDQMKKITEFSAKWMKTIAEERGRNLEEAQLAVTESKSFTDIDALNLNLIDLRADNLQSLISEINGRKVKLASGAEVTLDTSDYELTRNEMSTIERFLHAISDPNIAYILLSIGTIGIIAELYNPGMFFPGIIGVISLLIAFYSLGVLDANLGGILLIVLAFALFIAEMFTSTFGILTAGGIASLVLGSLLLFPGRIPLFQINPWLIAGSAIFITAVFAFIIQRVIKAQHSQSTTGWEELIGKPARVEVALAPEGMVLFRGERWKAISESGRVEPKEEVIITRMDNLKLYVTKKQGGK
ncbi:MAG: nodulation protein NfeD [Dehalococcoidales bacterium]|nr:nodulation protein NfeD [Dehalococcoidales bacterium]